MDSGMEALDLESQQRKMLQVQTQPPEAHKSQNNEAERRETAALQIPAPIAWQEKGPEAQRSIEAGLPVDEGRDAEAYAAGEDTLQKQLNQFPNDEGETQLAAIRELMARARARGVWLSLGEIAEATEFGEASISAQLRHLRKAHHGGFRVEKRRRGEPRRHATTRKIRDSGRGPIIWEYRVLPPSAGRTLRASAQAGSGAGRTSSERRAAEEVDA